MTNQRFMPFQGKIKYLTNWKLWAIKIKTIHPCPAFDLKNINENFSKTKIID
jgi:hypothetical protein